MLISMALTSILMTARLLRNAGALGSSCFLLRTVPRFPQSGEPRSSLRWVAVKGYRVKGLGYKLGDQNMGVK